MTITQKKNGKYKVRVYVGYDSLTGKQSYKSATVATLKEAKLKEAQLSVQIGTGELVPTWEQDKPLEHYTFDMAYEEWFEVYRQQGLAKSTVDKTEQVFRLHFLKPDLFGGMYLERMNNKDIQERVNKFLVSMSSSRKLLSYASKVFKYAVTSDHIICDRNPLESIQMVKPKKAPKREIRYYMESQAKRFEEGINEYFGHRFKFVVAYTILLRTGIRTGELLGLHWSDIDFYNQTMLLDGRMSVDGKGVSTYLHGLKNGDDKRVVDLDGHTVNVLRMWRKAQLEQSLLSGNPLTDDSFIVDMKRTSLANALYKFNDWYNENHSEELPHLNLHGLRHTHATLLISNGVEMKHVSDRLGHADMMTTANIYAEVTPRAKRDVANKFSEILEGG